MSTLSETVKSISFVVYGTPQQRGSKSPWVLKDRKGNVRFSKNGKPVIVTRDDNDKSAPWMEAVKAAAGDVYSEPLITGPVKLSVVFHFARPKSHYRTGRHAGLLRDGAPQYFHTKKPDLGKLLRSIEDACTGVVYRDDAQVVRYDGSTKLWTAKQARAEVIVRELQDENPE